MSKRQTKRLTTQHVSSGGASGIFGDDAQVHDKSVGRVSAKVEVGFPTQGVSVQQNSTQSPSQVVVVVTATPYPTLPATISVVQPSSRVQLVSSEATGTATRKTYNVTLASDEVIVGDAYDFQDKGYSYKLLKAEGELVSVMSKGFTFRDNKKSQEFRRFVEQNGYWEDLPEGSFTESGTNVNTVLVYLRK